MRMIWELFMLRKASPARRRSFTPMARVARERRGLALIVAAVLAAPAVNADSLAQPKDPALERQAAHYVRFREDVAAVEATPFDSPETTREAHRRLSAHVAEDLAGGWVAYAALVAADTPSFKTAIESEVEAKKRRRRRGELQGRDAFLAKISQDPKYVRSLDGAKDAMDRVLAVTVQDASRFTALGEAFKSQAYAMQKTAWGKKNIGASAARLTDAESFARSRPQPTPPAMARDTKSGVVAPSLASLDGQWSPNWGVGGGVGSMSERNADVIMDRVLNLAARYATDSLNRKYVSVYARNDRSTQCLSMATLTLKQCIAATRTPYEEAFCLGEHALNDISTCLGWVAGVDADS